MLFFIDESGHPHPNDSDLRPVILSVGIPITKSREFARQVFNLKRNLLGTTDPWLEEKYKARAILNSRTFERVISKWQYVEGLFEIAVNFPVVTFAIVMERPGIELTNDAGSLPYHWACLIQRINTHVAETAVGHQALLLMDSQHSGYDTRLSIQNSNYLFRSTQGKRLLNKDRGILNSTPYGNALARLYRSAKRTVSDYIDTDGTTWYGEYFMPAERMERYLGGVDMLEQIQSENELSEQQKN